MSIAAAGSSVCSVVCAPDELSSCERGEAFALLNQHFDGVSRDQFEHDLSQKNTILTLRHGASGALVGFSTMLVYETCFDKTPISVVVSGDTIVDPTAWASAALPREWIAAVKRLRLSYPCGPYYWLLITSGFRTYRLLSTFWRTFHPHYQSPTLPNQRRLLDHLAHERFGRAYNPSTGIVRFVRPQTLRPHLSGIPAARLEDPHVAYFVQRNPGHLHGDELACLCELTDANLTRAGERMALRPEARDT